MTITTIEFKIEPAEKFVLDPKPDGLSYWTFKGTSHYRRFTEVVRSGRIQIRGCRQKPWATSPW